MKIKNGFAPADGSNLSYEVCGTGPPVVLIHGFSLDMTMWDNEVHELSSSHSIVRYDLRGHGRSVAGNTRYSHSGDLRVLFDHLGLKKAVLVGLSLGGSTALNFAIAHPERVNALVVIDPSLSGFAWSKDTADSQQKIVGLARTHGVDALRARWLSLPLFHTAVANPRSAERLRSIIAGYSGWHWLNPDLGIPTSPPTITRLREISVPTLIVVGEFDTRDFHEIAATLQSKISNAQKVVIRGSGHMVNLERPEEFITVLKKFLSDVEHTVADE